jgi:hypothetical protein
MSTLHPMKAWLCAVCLAGLAFAAACENSPMPPSDRQPPAVDLSLSVTRSAAENSRCTMLVIFHANPMGSRDAISPQSALRIRWDFEGNGTWDTDFEPLAVRALEPNPLPVGEWTVRCEVVDEAGNSRVLDKSILLPAWLPTSPDIIATSLEVHSVDTPLVPADSLAVNQAFDVTVWHRDWTTPAGRQFAIGFFVDGTRVGLLGSQTYYPDPQHCESVGLRVASGIGVPGTHEIRAVLDYTHVFGEADELNNTAVQTVVVVE